LGVPHNPEEVFVIRRIVIWFSLALTVFSDAGLIWIKSQIGGFTIEDFSGIGFVTGMVIVGCLILVHRSHNRLGWLFTAIGLLWAVSSMLREGIAYVVFITGQVGASLPWLALAGSWFSDLAWGTSATFVFLLFPDGRLPSPRWRWVAGFVGGILLVGLALNLFTPGPLSQMPDIENPLGIPGLKGIVNLWNQLEVLFLLMIMTCLASVFIRYLGADSQVRRQIKWVAYLGLVLAFLYLVQVTVSNLWTGSLASRALDALGALVFGGFPLVVGIAVLRYRLFDIDLIIRRTLQYFLITGLLSLIYFGGVALLESLLAADRGLTIGGEKMVSYQPSSSIGIVITTLAIAALFNPLRRRIQDFIDRRFYRQKYDAERVLAEFAAAARSETNLERLSSRLTGAVQETLHPERVVLWIKPIQRPKAGQ
jgi:hypothetical protein